jgi:hypothetical protein
MAIILAIDPGITTGYVLARVDPNICVLAYSQEVWEHLGLMSFLTKIQPDYVICESFEYRPGERKGVVLYPCELIGIVHLYRQMYGCELTMQPASIQGAKSAYWDDSKLKAADLYLAGDRYHHGRQALKHFMHWLMFGAGAKFNAVSSASLVDMDLLLTSLATARNPQSRGAVQVQEEG